MLKMMFFVFLFLEFVCLVPVEILFRSSKIAGFIYAFAQTKDGIETEILTELANSGAYSDIGRQEGESISDDLTQEGKRENMALPVEAADTALYAKDSADGSRIPDWLKRTAYGVFIESKQKPQIYFETVQPLFQSSDKTHTFFTHDRISVQNGRGIYSAGLGYRRLLFDESLLAGLNTFFDFQDLHKHYRGGLGFEGISTLLELRANSYFGLSPKRKVSEGGTAICYEKAINGGDIELGFPIPYLPWCKIFGSFYRYEYRVSKKDMSGWKLRGELKPFKFFTINLATYDDNKGKRAYQVDSRVSLLFDDFNLDDVFSEMKLTKDRYNSVDLKEHALDRVERNFNIQVEKWIETGGMTIEIGRK